MAVDSRTDVESLIFRVGFPLVGFSSNLAVKNGPRLWAVTSKRLAASGPKVNWIGRGVCCQSINAPPWIYSASSVIRAGLAYAVSYLSEMRCFLWGSQPSGVITEHMSTPTRIRDMQATWLEPKLTKSVYAPVPRFDFQRPALLIWHQLPHL
jgi:hypothetical protein